MEGLSIADADLTVYVDPSNANRVWRAVLRQLSTLLFTYDETFEGVVLAYEVRLRSRTANILPGLIPYFGVKLKANMLLFSPKPDMLLEGKVVKLGKESIHVIVLGFCSAAIMFKDIRKEFKYEKMHGVRVFSSKSHKRHRIKQGSLIRFLVKSFDEETLHITGSLKPEHTGCIRWLFKHGEEDALQIDRSVKKRQRERDIKREVHEHCPDAETKDDQSLDNGRPHKLRKKTSGK